MSGGVGGLKSSSPSGPGLDAKSLEELEEIKAKMAKIALDSMKGGPVAAADLRGLSVGRDPAALRDTTLPPPPQEANATGTITAALGLSNDVNDPESKDLKNKLIEMGFLKGPADKVTQEQFEQAIKKSIEQGMAAAGANGELPSDMEELMAMVDSLLQKEAHRRNGAGSGFQRPGRTDGGGASGSRYSPRSTGGAPATEPMVPINPNAPAPGKINEAIAAAAQNYMGTSTRGGPDGGNLACAWSVNNILRAAGVKQLGDNPNAVASAKAALEGGRGERIDPKDAKPGDIVIWPPPRSHIGIAGGNGVLHNSSSRAAFVNNTAIPAGASVYRVTN